MGSEMEGSKSYVPSFGFPVESTPRPGVHVKFLFHNSHCLVSKRFYSYLPVSTLQVFGYNFTALSCLLECRHCHCAFRRLPPFTAFIVLS